METAEFGLLWWRKIERTGGKIMQRGPCWGADGKRGGRVGPDYGVPESSRSLGAGASDA